MKASDFGHLHYGSKLLNVTFDPDIPEQLASYSHDDDGTPASKQFLIREGLLLKPLGGALSQFRSGMSGVANSRASSWNRAPIDRMANLNIEAGDKSLAQLIGGIYGFIAKCRWLGLMPTTCDHVRFVQRCQRAHDFFGFGGCIGFSHSWIDFWILPDSVLVNAVVV